MEQTYQAIHVNTALWKAKIILRSITNRTHNTQSLSNIQHNFNIRLTHTDDTQQVRHFYDTVTHQTSRIRSYGLTRKHVYRAVINLHSNRAAGVFVSSVGNIR
jgi:hypothetical protein